MRISSGTAIAGCVSLSWMATLSGSAFQSDWCAGSAGQIGQRAGDEEVLLDEP
jgi:hypothetical protein